eukprot:4858978-Pyramimonas_sp.AAC.1
MQPLFMIRRRALGKLQAHGLERMLRNGFGETRKFALPLPASSLSSQLADVSLDGSDVWSVLRCPQLRPQ